MNYNDPSRSSGRPTGTTKGIYNDGSPYAGMGVVVSEEHENGLSSTGVSTSLSQPHHPPPSPSSSPLTPTSRHHIRLRQHDADNDTGCDQPKPVKHGLPQGQDTQQFKRNAKYSHHHHQPEQQQQQQQQRPLQIQHQPQRLLQYEHPPQNIQFASSDPLHRHGHDDASLSTSSSVISKITTPSTLVSTVSATTDASSFPSSYSNVLPVPASQVPATRQQNRHQLRHQQQHDTHRLSHHQPHSHHALATNDDNGIKEIDSVEDLGADSTTIADGDKTCKNEDECDGDDDILTASSAPSGPTASATSQSISIPRSTSLSSSSSLRRVTKAPPAGRGVAAARPTTSKSPSTAQTKSLSPPSPASAADIGINTVNQSGPSTRTPAHSANDNDNNNDGDTTSRIRPAVFPGAVAYYPPGNASNSLSTRRQQDIIDDRSGNFNNVNIGNDNVNQHNLPRALPASEEDYVVTTAVTVVSTTLSSLVQTYDGVDDIDSRRDIDHKPGEENMIKSGSDASNNSRFSKSKILMIASIVALLGILSLIVVMIIGLANKGDENSSQETIPFLPSPSPTFLPTSREQKEYVQYLFTYHNITVDPNDLRNKGSSQYKALKWLALEDEMATSPNDPSMLERYVLAVFYFSLKGDTSWNTNNRWLSSDRHVCSWWGVNGCTAGDSSNSVDSTGARRITILDMSKCLFL